MTFRLDFAVLSDLSANIFAAFLLVLLLLLAAMPDGGRGGPPAPPPAAIEVERDLVSVTRAPLAADAVVTLLFARRAGGGLSIDLFDDRIALSGAGAPLVLDPLREGVGAAFDRLDRLLAQAPAQGPVRLYVFGHRWYVPVTERLRRRALDWREMSVPAALRAGADGPARWSDGFARLPADPADKAGFRRALARLLAGGPGQPSPGFGTPGAAAPEVERAGLRQRVAAALAIAVGYLMLGAALVVVVVVERRVPR